MSIPSSQEQIDDFVNACHGNFKAVKTLLAGRPELLNAHSSLNEPPFGAAAHVGIREIAEYLVAQGAEVDLPAAVMLGDVETVETVEKILSTNSDAASGAGAHGIPVVFHAVAGGDVPMLELLLDSGAAASVITGPESAALNMAAARGHTEMARWLIDNHAPTDTKDFQGMTALERAEGAGHDEIVALIETNS